MLANLEAVFGRPLAPLLVASHFQNWPRDRWARMAYSYDPPGRWVPVCLSWPAGLYTRSPAAGEPAIKC